MATQVNEKLAESVRNYPCLYDKTSPDFKNRDKKMLAWSDVAEEVGLQNKVIIIALCLSFHKNVSYPDLPRFSLCLSLHKQFLFDFYALNSSNNPISTSFYAIFDTCEVNCACAMAILMLMLM